MTISHEYAEELGRQIDELEAENERLRDAIARCMFHGRLQTPRQAFETIIESLRYDGNDIDSLTIGEIRRALP